MFPRFRSSQLKSGLAAAFLTLLAACGGGNSANTPLKAELSSREARYRILVINGEAFEADPCAGEDGMCLVPGEQNVAYGTKGKYVVKRFIDKAPCNNRSFGDPLVGVLKHCYVAAALATGAAPAASSGGTGTVVSASPVAAPAIDLTARISKQQASRFLVQATYGPNMREIDRLADMGYGPWLNEQFATTSMDSHWNYIQRKGPVGCNPCNSKNITAFMESFWLQAVRAPDQVRQRFVLALTEIFVLSTVNTAIGGTQAAYAGYVDMLAKNAFGNFRTLLEQVATHPSMGVYLSHMKNEKEDAATGRLPDENFAREVMQLFSIGLWELNEDGSRKKGPTGEDIPTYTQADIMGMAKVFTGYGYGNGRWDDGWTFSNPDHPWEQAYNVQMVVNPALHSTSEKRIVGGVLIPANTSGPESLKIAVDTLFNHPNVGPFIGSQLIKRVVTSNPSPSYIKRVSQAFNNNGQGVRGDMKAVIKAILLDPEALDPAKLNDPRWGKLREPMIRYANFMRAFDVKSRVGVYRLHNLEDTLKSIGQNPLKAPSVFNWFRPDYAPPGTIVGQGLVAPEFQITHETTTTGYVNFMADVAETQNTWYRDNIAVQHGEVSEYLAGDYSAEMTLARDPNALLDRLNLLLMSGQMSPSTRNSILAAITATPADAGAGQRRVAFAVFLILTSPEFIVQK